MATGTFNISKPPKAETLEEVRQRLDPARAFKREYGDGPQASQRAQAQGYGRESERSSDTMPAPREPLPKQEPVKPVVSVEEADPDYEAKQIAKERLAASETARLQMLLVRCTFEEGDGVPKGL